MWHDIVTPKIAVCLDELQSLGRALTAEGRLFEKLEPGAGDAHHYGKTTTKITSADGTYYFKPARSSKRLLVQSVFRAADMPDHIYVPCDTPLLDGYVQESVPPPEPSVSKEEFWHRAGAFAAVSDCLNVVDAHYENVVPAGASIALIDDETIMTASPFGHERNLLTTLLLQDTDAIEIAAGFMAAATPSVSNYYPTLLDAAGGEHMTVRTSTRIESRATTIARHFGSISDFSDEFVDGLRQGYSKISSHGLSVARAIRKFGAGSKSRAVLFSTPGYRRLTLLISTSPTSASKHEIEERVLRDLQRFDRKAVAPQILRSEISQLMRGDVPMFTIDVTSREIYDGEDRVGEITMSPVDESCSRIFGLDRHYIDDQCAIARRCLSSPSLS